MAKTVEIVEVSPRDGIQNEKTLLPTEIKLELIERAVAAGVRRLEATSFVNPKRVPQMADADEVARRLPRGTGARYVGLVLNPRGFERARAAGIDEINFVIVATETFNRRNQGVAVGETLAAWHEIAALTRQAGMRAGVTIGASFGCPFEGEVPVERVVTLARQLAEAGPHEIALADTIGAAAPSDIRRKIEAVRDALPGMPLRCHLHNTRNTGLANAVAAIEAGAVSLDSSIGGVGGCPFAPAATGNIPTEDLVYMLDRMGIETGLDLDGLIETAAWLGRQLAISPPGMLHRAGRFPPPAADAQVSAAG
ncbi:hydroxymethylglutaryl-CoA lyase [Aquibium sp. A9E412]|uniref:hydroxymethylglutaryl-CoA lyase n=1 Tax=Aquibium sp. A9E412 TaxID=2976767 RepID=UPI0025AFE277|nr:hydroxymethylglutaryl-CoA lyase [Aquibium sp. A9E412]MDN2567594.1 hydroxymethylglutaryl-CoA lyase [Aquibium sp. A9E412]